MEFVNQVSTSQNEQNFSDVLVERPKAASKNSEPIKSEIEHSGLFRVSAFAS